MARHIDLAGKLSLERPTITLNGKVYKVNDEKTNILLMNNELKKLESLAGNELEVMDRVLELLLGKKAVKEIDDLKLSLVDFKTVVLAVMAVVQDSEVEKLEETFR